MNSLEIGKRLYELRKKDLKMSREAFGKKIGVQGEVIRNLENDKNKKINEPLLLAICSQYGINKDWLLYGTGEKYIQDKDSMVNDLANKYNLSLCGKQILKTYLELSDDKKAVIDEFIEQLLDNYNDSKTSDDDYVTFVAADGIINKTLKIKKSDIGIDKDNFK